MTERPQILTESPGGADPLSDLLAGMHLAGMVLFRGVFTEPWSVMSPSHEQMARLLPFRAEHIIPFHLIASGGCRLSLPDGETAWLSAGDAVLLPNGDEHTLGGRDPANTVHIGEILPPPPWADTPIVDHGGTGAKTDIVCGFLQCDAVLFQPLLGQLPTVLHVSPASTPDSAWLAGTIRHTIDQVSRPASGSRSMLPRLTELMFVEILRDHLRRLPDDQIGWLSAYKDPVAGAALRCLHGAPMQDWSLETLACAVGVSRSVLTARFRHFLGLPPMRYVAQLRLQIAAQRMRSSDTPIKAIVEEVGYESEAAFGRAFKRCFGVAPGEWRRRQQAPTPPRDS